MPGMRHWIRDAASTPIETLIEPGPFAFGARPTLADIYLVPQVFNARRFDISARRLPEDRRCRRGLLQLPAFEKAAPARQPDAVET